VRYGEAEQRRIAVEVARPPERARDGTATWSLVTLRDALRRAEDGLPGISTYTIGRTLCGRFRLAEEPDLVRNGRGCAQA
jgi:hypothetical protein